MRIECPSCSAAYEVPDAVLASRRLMRCARCATNWSPDSRKAAVAGSAFDDNSPDHIASPAQASAARNAQPVSVSAGQPDLADSTVHAPDYAAHAMRLRRSSVIAAWIASVLLLLMLTVGAVHWRQRVMHAWPPSIRLYALLHLA